jgi:hypothetical protein
MEEQIPLLRWSKHSPVGYGEFNVLKRIGDFLEEGEEGWISLCSHSKVILIKDIR